MKSKLYSVGLVLSLLVSLPITILFIFYSAYAFIRKFSWGVEFMEWVLGERIRGDASYVIIVWFILLILSIVSLFGSFSLIIAEAKAKEDEEIKKKGRSY